MHDELLATLIAWISGSLITATLIALDRRFAREVRLYGWYDATLYLAVSGLFFPAPLAFGAYLWATRKYPWGWRLLLALAGSTSAVTLTLFIVSLLLELFGIG